MLPIGSSSLLFGLGSILKQKRGCPLGRPFFVPFFKKKLAAVRKYFINYSMKKSWLSAALFYNEPWENFLIEAVAPYIETVVKTGIAESYFFIRYWERGPHIRLRFKGETTALEEVLKPNLTEHFNAYFKANPSERTPPEYPDNFPEAYKWLPNNQLQFETYEPELNRYGGVEGLKIAEQQFQLSSHVVLDFFTKNPQELDYQDLLGVAIRMHLGFAYRIGLHQHQIPDFFAVIFENWLSRAIYGYENDLSEEAYQVKQKETVALFEDSFQKQKEAVVPFINQLLKDLASKAAFDSGSFNLWLQDNQRLSTALEKLAQSNRIVKRINSYEISQRIAATLSEPTIRCWNIWADYVHMTNNRLGIANRDEPYLAYLIKRSLEMVKF